MSSSKNPKNYKDGQNKCSNVLPLNWSTCPSFDQSDDLPFVFSFCSKFSFTCEIEGRYKIDIDGEIDYRDLLPGETIDYDFGKKVIIERE